MKMLLLLAGTLLPGLACQAQGNIYKTKICVIEKGELKEAEGEYNTQTGDHRVTLNGVRKHKDSLHINNPDYAASAKWYINNDSLVINGKAYQKFGLPRILGIKEISKWTTYKNVGVYVEAGSTADETGTWGVIYIPIRAECEFQPYMREL